MGVRSNLRQASSTSTARPAVGSSCRRWLIHSIAFFRPTSRCTSTYVPLPQSLRLVSFSTLHTLSIAVPPLPHNRARGPARARRFVDDFDVGGTVPRHVPVVLPDLPAMPSRDVGLLSMSFLGGFLLRFDLTSSESATPSSNQIQARL